MKPLTATEIRKTEEELVYQPLPDDPVRPFVEWLEREIAKRFGLQR